MQAAATAQRTDIRSDWQEAAGNAPSAESQPNWIGRYYVAHAAPMKGAQPDADGKCLFMLKCFPVPADATPGQVGAMRFADRDAEFHVYHGHIAREKAQKGLVVGYVDDFYGSDKVRFAGAEDMRGTVVTETRGLMTQRPRVTTDFTMPRYGAHEAQVQSGMDEIMTLRAIKAICYPQPAPRTPRNVC